MGTSEVDEREPAIAEAAAAEPGVDVLVSLTRPWTVVVSLVGDHDVTSVGSLVRQAEAHVERCDRLVVDLSATTFLDSAVVGALVELAREARSRGVVLQVVAAPGGQAHRVLAVMGLLAHLGWTEQLPELHAARNGRSRAGVPVSARPAATSGGEVPRPGPAGTSAAWATRRPNPFPS